jgi:ABC-2 type transport system permease protein
MRITASFIKTFKENIRDWKIIILVIFFAPFFVYLMYLYMGSPSASTYNVVVVNYDQNGKHSRDIIDAWTTIKSDDNNILNVNQISDAELAKKMIRDKIADVCVTIPPDFSKLLDDYLSSGKGDYPSLISYGDQSNVKYMMAGSFIDYVALNYVSLKAGIKIPLSITYESAGNQKSIRAFDLYIPALLVLSVIMILFTAGASIIREIEKETITRLSLSRLTSFEFMGAISANQIVIGLAGIFLTYLAALSVGYQTKGSLVLLLVIGIITCFAVISISIITASFIKNMFGLLTVGCFPFFILMFFSDCFMPLPKIELLKVFGNQLFLNDILPTATATRAMNKVLNFNATIIDIQFELLWITIVSIVYFIIGVALFRRKHKY